MDDKTKHRYRRHLQRKHKLRDRWKPKGRVFSFLPITIKHYRHWDGEKDWTLGFRKTHTETGYGVAREVRRDIV